MRLLQFTDTHLYAQPEHALYGLNTDRTCRQVLASARRAQRAADLVLLTGDLVHDASPQGYQRLAAHVAQLGSPALALAGNHDEPALMARLWQDGPVSYRPEQALGSWRIVLLNSHVPGRDHGRLGGEQLAAMDEGLAAHSHRYTLVCIHHHPVPVGSEWMDAIGLQDADELWGVLNRHRQVRGVLWGHVHQTYDGEHNGIRLMGTPSTCMQFKPRCAEFELDPLPPGYRWLELGPEGEIETGVVRVQTGKTAGLP